MAPANPSARGSEPIAIVGSGCRFPGGASSPSKLWELLRDPRDVLQEIPQSRFDVRGFYHPDPQFPGHTNVKHSYLLEQDVSRFDAQFFNITGAEAVSMDPQQRLLLETVYESIESAGLTIEGMKGSGTAVYVGLMYTDWEAVQFRDLQHVPTYLATGSARSIVSNRISYFFDWHGPSVTVDTACSSSLVAVDQAVQALRAGHVRVALAAGTNLLLGPEPYIHESKLKMLSPDGRSRMWDAKANGYARGDGVAALVLKTLSAALADGDCIQAVIRETGVNQDGRSRGITMPSATAQTALIRETYARAGLDPAAAEDRCQYFEAHGTGTPAGDPVEAEAVHTAFFEGAGAAGSSLEAGRRLPLYVGSIKTVVGHTESTAGIAGILKVVLAMKHGYIPPNMLLERLNPQVLPFYQHLKIPQELTPWPQPPPGQPRRASVNSFGFGGTNAHVILESPNVEPLGVGPASPGGAAHTVPVAGNLYTPFLFSAQSKQSLQASIAAHLEYLEAFPDTDPRDLAWTLRSRRSRLQLRVSLPASDIQVLRSNLAGLAGDFQLDQKSAGVRSSSGCTPRLLGIFTGQGAQWAHMGAELVEGSAYVAGRLAELDGVLAQLPEPDRPPWTLRQELLADASSSNVGMASVAQPLCTAVQVILVDVLRLCGIGFAAVVGHSSGEIGAAYASGYVSAREAIRIAYYRGLYSHLAGGPGGIKGSMLAVGTTLQDAKELCEDEYFFGRVQVAACNSPSSVTLSGDEDAIAEMADIFEDENKFVRRLRVDKAYHSHHMVPCSQPYLEAMSSEPPSPAAPQAGCVWVSSVGSGGAPGSAGTTPRYWVDNLLSPVMFSQAVEEAMPLGPFDAAIEVGPHPALRGPVRDTIQSLNLGPNVAGLPYTGLLQRNTSAIQSISAALGYLWSSVDGLNIDFDQYERALGGPVSHRFIPDLPSYQWNHSQRYWHESSLSRSLRLRDNPVHPLLGDLLPHSSPHRFEWKNILRPRDLPWVHDHKIQGQTVFPAAGYAATAIETVPFLVDARPVLLIEIDNLVVHQAMVFENDDQDAGIEVRSAVGNIDKSLPGFIRGRFTYESCTDPLQPFKLVASGDICVSIGAPSPQTLPATGRLDPYMVDVPAETVYSVLKDIGYGYTGSFKALSSLKRKLGKASGSLAVTAPVESNGQVLSIHPAMLDAAFHSIILAFSYPRDGRLWTLHLPTSIRKIKLNPSLCGGQLSGSPEVPFVASMPPEIDGSRADRTGFQGDVEIHNPSGDHSILQVEGLHVVPFTPADASDDQKVFYALDWIDAEPNADVPEAYAASAQERELAMVLERGSFFYLRQLAHVIPADHPGRSDKYNAAYLNFASHTQSLALQGKHRYVRREWANDSLQDILALSAPFSEHPEIKAMHVVGEQMPRAIRGETTMLEHLMASGILSDYYAKAQSVVQGTRMLAEVVAQISRRYPHCEILEVGAGTGGATREILGLVGDRFAAYTFTDVSAGFFVDAQDEFAPFQDRMTYRVLDLEKDVQAQGFKESSCDVLVASFVIHATRSIAQTLRRVRTLLKPGGYLVLYEVTNTDIVRGTALFGCLPGWWQGLGEGRTLGACVSEIRWDAELRTAGFSGVDTMTHTSDALSLPNSVIVSQAVDTMVQFLREPLVATAASLPTPTNPIIRRLVIIGGVTLRVSRLAGDLGRLVGPHAEHHTVTRIDSLAMLGDDDGAILHHDATVIVLEDLDHAVFRAITPERWRGLKTLFRAERSIVWVTQNRLLSNPWANLSVGFARSACWDVPGLRYQFIDLEGGIGRPGFDARTLAENILRFSALASSSTSSSASRSKSESQQRRAMLWSLESEIVVGPHGGYRLPRLEPVTAANDRYNSARRPIVRQARLDTHTVVASEINGRRFLRESPRPARNSEARVLGPNSCNGSSSVSSWVTLRVSHSTLHPVRMASGKRSFAILGRCVDDGTEYVCLVDIAASRVEVQQTELVPLGWSDNTDKTRSRGLLLAMVAANLICPVLTEGLAENDTLLVHNVPPELEAVLGRHTRALGIRLLRTTSSKQDSNRADCILLDRFARLSHLQSLLPRHVSRCVDFSPVSGLSASLLKQFLPRGTPVIPASSICSSRSLSASTGQMLRGFLDLAWEDAAEWHRANNAPLSSLFKLDDISEKQYHGVVSVCEWNADATVPIVLQPIAPAFHATKTYWLVGLSGSLGASIADWMIENGTRYLVVTSRTPQMDQAWLDSARHRGAVVRTMSCDLTDYDSLRATYAEIRATLPPLAGVYQGAMVLRDASLESMDLEKFTTVLGPKVEGSINLDRVLGDVALDFLIFFSSVATVAGNVGQANYTAANLFMSGLALDRRRRGLAASVVGLGPILGTGYITREKGDVLTQPMFERGLLTISESDAHRTLAEAIRSSRPGSGMEFEIYIGLRRMPASAPNLPRWYRDPQFACLIMVDAGQEKKSLTPGSHGGASISDRLADAGSREEVATIITENFLAEMRKMLHLSDDYAITPAVRTDELGLDSLVAVRIRSWFLNNLQVNIPALKILKGASLQDLIDQATEEMPLDLAPNLESAVVDGESESAPTPPTSTSESETDPDRPETETQVSATESEASYAADRNGAEEVDAEKGGQPSREQPLRRSGPLSFTQSVFFFVHELLEHKATLNNIIMLRLKGELRVGALADAVRALGQRHESLRSCIRTQEGQLIQGVLPASRLSLEHRQLDRLEDLAGEYEAMRNHVFNLGGGDASRTTLLSLSPTEHYLLLCSHHIFFDRASIDTVMSDLELLYRGLPLVADPLQYLDYSNNQHDQNSSGHWNDAIEFWRHEFAQVPDPLPLHKTSALERQPLACYKSRVVDFTIRAQLVAKIRRVAAGHRSTPFHFYLAAFSALLRRFLGSSLEDVCIGIADSCRDEEHMRSGIGAFLNMLPLRLHNGGPGQKFADALEEARRKSLSALTNSIPLEVILNELRVSRQATHTPLAQAFMNYAENGIEDGQSFLGCAMEMARQDVAELPYDITLTVINNIATRDTRILLNVQASLYSEADAQLLAHGFEDMLAEFAHAPDTLVGDVWHYREPALREALNIGRGPQFQSTWPETLVHRFEQVVHEFPEGVAVEDESGFSLTYKALAGQTDLVAAELVGAQVRPGDRVAVLQEPSALWVVSVMAILKIGAVYVPLDTATPVARLALMARDCEPTAILAHELTLATAEILRSKAQLGSCTTIIDTSGLRWQPRACEVRIAAKQSSPAIILYTSGSTGTPKGVILQHGSLKHEFDHCAATYRLEATDIVLQQSAWSFDLSVTQLFLALGVGAKLRMVSRLTRLDSRAVVELIETGGITVTYATPTEYKAWFRREYRGRDVRLPNTSRWRLALVAGEPVTDQVLGLFRETEQPGLRLFNVYGPTETTCGSTKFELDYTTPGLYKGEAIPVGRASANECFYILDEKHNLLPAGQTGEVVIGGVGVAQGYVIDLGGKKEHSHAVTSPFMPDPFATDMYQRQGWTTMYRTGDAGFLRADGILILKGRIADDTEVKLNGMRTNLKEVEQAVIAAADGALADAVASVRATLPSAGPAPDEEGTKFIVVHAVFHAGQDYVGGLQEKVGFLRALIHSLPIPLAMRPSAIVPVDSLPRTVSGKVDRPAASVLPIPHGLSGQQASNERHGRGSTLSGAETAVLNLWRLVIPDEVIGLHGEIDPDADFFSVGGSSILLIKLQHLIRKRLGRSVPLLGLFQSNTLRSMARFLDFDNNASSSVGGNDEEQEQQDLIDWATEASLEEDFSAGPVSSGDVSPAVAAPPRCIVLTGATGFLGQHILRALAELEQVNRIICIAVRDPNHAKVVACVGSAHGSKVEVHAGDLRLPDLGLTPAEAARVFQLADAVIHNGADVSHLKTYASLRAANVASTRRLAALCVSRRIPLHYVSTTGVTMYTSCQEHGEVSVRESPPPPCGRDSGLDYGYVASKWVSEVLLENVHARFGLPVYIHRPSSILRPGQHGEGRFDEPGGGNAGAEHRGELWPISMEEVGTFAHDDVVQNLLGYARRLCAVPVVSAASLQAMGSGVLDLVRPQTVTRQLVATVMGYRRENGGEGGDDGAACGVVFIHESGDLEVQISHLQERLAVAAAAMVAGSDGTNSNGGKDAQQLEGERVVGQLPLDEWIGAAKEAGLPAAMAAVFQGLLGGQHVMNLPQLLRA
ncbi:hypothetical protein RB595_006943 [Gaeumannomyces hyphopodioides]